MSAPQGFSYTDFSRGEAALGLGWLCLGALGSLLLEVFYLGARLPLPGGTSLAFPITILIAFYFNGVLVKTGQLWSTNPWVAALPLYVWVLGFFALLLLVGITGDQLLANSIRSVGLLFAGVAGAVWPLARGK